MNNQLELNEQNIRHWHDLFVRINMDLEKNRWESVVPLDDVEYYAQQIHNLSGEVDMAASHNMAHAIRTLDILSQV